MLFVQHILNHLHVLHICKPRSHQTADIPNTAAADTSATANGVPEQPDGLAGGIGEEVAAHAHHDDDDVDDDTASDSLQLQYPRRNAASESTAGRSTVRSLEDAHRILFCFHNVNVSSQILYVVVLLSLIVISFLVELS